MTDGRLGSLLGFDVIVNSAVPDGEIYILPGREMIVRDMWQTITWPLLLADWRRQAREDLNRLVRAAEERLGLEPSERPGLPPRFAPGGTWVSPRRSLADLRAELRVASDDFEMAARATAQSMAEFAAAWRTVDPCNVVRITGVT